MSDGGSHRGRGGGRGGQSSAHWKPPGVAPFLTPARPRAPTPSRLRTSGPTPAPAPAPAPPPPPPPQADSRTLSNIVKALLAFGVHTARSALQDSIIQVFLHYLNTASEEDLKTVKGLGHQRIDYILQLREESSEPFMSVEDLQEIKLSPKEVNNLLRDYAADIFH
ncbi:hypothetical protein LguiA_000517 [Lonicera macranthoides]